MLVLSVVLEKTHILVNDLGRALGRAMSFWRPGAVAPGATGSLPSSARTSGPVPAALNVNEDRESAAEGAHAVVQYNAWARLGLQQQRARLPIAQHQRELVYALEQYRTLLVVGSTGSGKSTQLAQYWHEAGWTKDGRIICIAQPRRVAAMSLAQRVAEERGCVLGDEVGYAVRFDEVCDPLRTRIKYVTDGVLLRELLLDPLLRRYSIVVLDEAHERSVPTDLAMALLKKVQRQRPELRVVLASATLDVTELQRYWSSPDNSVGCVVVEGRQFPVDHYFLSESCENYVTAALEAAWQIHVRCTPGTVLVFMTGQEECERLVAMLEERHERLRSRQTRPLGLRALALYAGQPLELQMRAFESPPEGVRKVVVSTNVAETSLTLPDVVYVVDCGFVKQRVYSADSDEDALVIVPVSQASAAQRAGRAGRVRPGQCYHLYTELEHSRLPVKDAPEMQRAPLASTLLQLKALGVDDIVHFDFVSPPPSRHVARGLELLHALGALDSDARLTPLGAEMALLPLEPAEAHLLLQRDSGCSEELLTIAAMLSVQNVFLQSRTVRGRIDSTRARYAVKEGDHLTLLNVYNDYVAHGMSASWCAQYGLNAKALSRAAQVRAQLRVLLRRNRVELVSANGDVPRIVRALVRSYFHHAAQRQPDGSYRTLRSNQPLHLHPSSVLFAAPPEWLIYHEVLLTAEHFMRECTAIDPQWLPELAPHFYAMKTQNLNLIPDKNVEYPSHF